MYEKENDRVREVRKRNNLTMEEFGKRVGVSRAAISRVESGANNVSEQMRRSICREFGVSETWLRTGEGEMYIKKSPDAELTEFVDSVLTDAPDSFRRRFVSMLTKINKEQWDLLADMVDKINEETEERRIDAEIEAKTEAYRQRLIEEASTRERSSGDGEDEKRA